MTKLSIIIVSYNVKYYLEQCLRSVAAAAAGIDVETIVVDNESSDGSIEYLEPLFPQVRFVRAGGNIGFSRANNMAVGMSSGNYVLFLNPDTVIAGNVLSDCIRFMDNHPAAGAAGVRMLNRDGSFARESRRGVPTPFVAFCKMSGLCSLFPKSKVLGRYYMGYLDEEAPARIDIVSGAFMMVRREALDRTGGFDETFFMYGEDVDLSYRILQEGYENWYIPVPILHYKGESTNKTSYAYSKVFYDAMLIFFNKHFRNYGRLLSFAVHVMVSVKTLFSFVGNNLHFRRRVADDSETWLFCGDRNNMEKAASLSGVPEMEYRTELPDMSLKCDVTVYDSSVFGYSEILGNMLSCPGRSHVAVFYPESGILLTDNEVIRYDGTVAD